MAKRTQKLFNEFGKLKTWIVGLQYYAGVEAATDREQERCQFQRAYASMACGRCVRRWELLPQISVGSV